MTEIGPHLERLGLLQYHDALVEEGFDTWETLINIQDADLIELNVKKGHRRRLQQAIQDYCRISGDRPLVLPSHEGLTETGSSSDVQSPYSIGRMSRTGPVPEVKRKYERHPKPDKNAPEKPPSAYVLFSNKVREEVKGRNLSFADLARLVGTRWHDLSSEQRHPFESQAATRKENYNALLTEYKKTESYRNYSAYVADFKAKHRPAGDKKRPKHDSQQNESAFAINSGEIAEASSSHTRGGSQSSISVTSPMETLPSPAGPTPAPAPAPAILHGINYPSARLREGNMSGGSPPMRQLLASERPILSHMSSQSSISEGSSANRSEHPDPLARTANLSLSTPPTGTPPLLSASLLPSRQDPVSVAEGYAWSRYSTPGHYSTNLAPSMTGPPGTGTLASPQGFPGDYSRSMHYAPGPAAGPQLPPITFPSRGILPPPPPLRQSTSTGQATSASQYQNRPGAPQTSIYGNVENVQLSQNLERARYSQIENEATKAGSDSLRQEPANTANRSDHRPQQQQTPRQRNQR